MEMGLFVVHYSTPFADRVVFIYFSRSFMDGSSERVVKSCQYFQKFVNHCHLKNLLLQHLLLINQAIVGNPVIHPYQIKCMEYYWNTNAHAPNRMTEISNQLVLQINSKNPVVVIIYGSGN